MFKGIWRDLGYAGRSLAKARAFTFVCVVTLGIGLAPVIAIPFGARLLTMTPPLVKTDGVVEVLTTRVGPRGATDQWSYPDYTDLRAADTGMTLTGWATGKTTVQTPAGKTDSPTLFVSANYFKTFGVELARGAGFDDAQRKRDSAQPQDAQRKRDSAQPQDAQRKRDSAQPQDAQR